jgi:hypothetical protein
MINLSIPKATDGYLTVTVTDENGAAVDITGWSGYWTCKADYNDTDANAKFQIKVTSHTDPTNGITTFTWTNAHTNQDVGEYFYDIVFVTNDATAKVYQMVSGKLYITWKATTAIVV